MEERVQKRRRGEGKGEEEESIALGNTNQMFAEDTLGIILKMANKKTIADGARTPKPNKKLHEPWHRQNTIIHCKAKRCADQWTGQQLKIRTGLNENTRCTSTYASVTTNPQHIQTAHQRDMFSLYRAITRKKHQKT